MELISSSNLFPILSSLTACKALSTLSIFYQLSPLPPPFQPLPFSVDSLPRIIQGLPLGATPGLVWDLLPVPVREIRMLEHGTREAIVEFWFEDDARMLESQPVRLGFS